MRRDLGDSGFFAGKVVVDIGPGPLGFPDACPARISIGVDPLAARYAEHGLLLPDSPAVYLSAGAERMPLLTAGADVVLARDSLDYVEDPEAVIREARRILRPGGTLILHVRRRQRRQPGQAADPHHGRRAGPASPGWTSSTSTTATIRSPATGTASSWSPVRPSAEGGGRAAGWLR